MRGGRKSVRKAAYLPSLCMPGVVRFPTQTFLRALKYIFYTTKRCYSSSKCCHSFAMVAVESIKYQMCVTIKYKLYLSQEMFNGGDKRLHGCIKLSVIRLFETLSASTRFLN